jgi:hypothetical protein
MSSESEVAGSRDKDRPTVREDRELTPGEKEVSITFSKEDDTARVFSAIEGVSRRLLAHDLVEVIEVVLVDEADGTRRQAALEDVRPSEEIVGVLADVDVGLITVSGQPRRSGTYADVITDRVLRSEEVAAHE